MKQKISFGSLEMRLMFHLEEKEVSTVSVREIARILKITKNHASKLVWQLVRKRRLIKLRKGIYLFAPIRAGAGGHWSEQAMAILPAIMKGGKYYVSFWAALGEYGLTEQLPRTVQVVAEKHMRNFEAVQTRFEFVRLKTMGEWREEKIAGKNIRIATIEQLLADCLAYPGLCGGMDEVCKAVWEARKKADWKKVGELAANSSDAAKRRLGYLMELLGIGKGADGGKFSGWRWLDPSAKKIAIGKSRRWGLFLNVTEKKLTEWRES